MWGDATQRATTSRRQPESSGASPIQRIQPVALGPRDQERWREHDDITCESAAAAGVADEWPSAVGVATLHSNLVNRERRAAAGEAMTARPHRFPPVTYRQAMEVLNDAYLTLLKSWTCPSRRTPASSWNC